MAEDISFLNQSAAATKPGRPSGKSPAVPPAKKKLNPSVRPCDNERFHGIKHMVERSSKQQRCKLERCTFKITSFCEKCDEY
ncbi:hypothetical protein AVEN_69930-1 [Araneus ventricosus]|uniref:Uncharacterized protein n=1 Tax=Araneus ventricosus TaxID=182803 RepID=A0A4Y2VFA9_ARAVE|nr:hypothetical protein AVEN_5882-1 [Araneus ventricosus]GBO23181.1 hypothetical protein AVEN_69930-1 [Araneus ventricosus]